MCGFWSHPKKPHVILWVFQDWLHVFGFKKIIWKVWSGGMWVTISCIVISITAFSATKKLKKSQKKAELSCGNRIILFRNPPKRGMLQKHVWREDLPSGRRSSEKCANIWGHFLISSWHCKIFIACLAHWIASNDVT